MKYIRTFIIETSIAYTVILLSLSISLSEMNGSQLQRIFLLTASITLFQDIFQHTRKNYLCIQNVSMAYIGGCLIFFVVGRSLHLIEFNMVSFLMYIVIHTVVFAFELMEENREIETINKKIERGEYE